MLGRLAPSLRRLLTTTPRLTGLSPLEVASVAPPAVPEYLPNWRPKSKRPLLSNSKYETTPSALSAFQTTLGESIVRFFRLDMDRLRAGSVAGLHYYGLAKQQGLVYPDEPLLESASFYYETLGLPQLFQQWFQITTLHYWLLSVRMRALPFKYGPNYQQKFVDRFFRDMELRLAEEMNIASGRIIQNYLKDFHSQLRGVTLLYDEAFASGDAVFAAALWRNLFGSTVTTDLAHVEAMVLYVRQQLYLLSKMSDREFGFGMFRFAAPGEVVELMTREEEEKMREAVRAEFASYTRPSQQSNLSMERL